MVRSPDDPLVRDRYALRPLIFPAAEAHAGGWITYDDDATVTCRHPALGGEALRIVAGRQYPVVRATFEDLNKALSRLATSPAGEGAATLRQMYEAESARYDALAAAAYDEGRFEPDYGSYVVDRARGELYLVAPEPWHRLALVTSNSTLLTDPDARLSWREVRARLEGAVIGFAGVSVGGNILEGWLREARPKQVKVADPDWLELTNLNRGERMSLRHMVQPRASRFDPRSPYETPRVPKAQYIAYEEQLVDPYVTFWVYEEGLTRANVETFLRGDGHREPPIDILVEETDNLELKLTLREECRRAGVDVLMLSDFGHCVHVMWNPFGTDRSARLGCAAPDAELHALVRSAKAGDRAKVFELIEGLCGPDFGDDRTDAWARGEGEQVTGSLPQSGGTAMASGAIGGKELALHVLGHDVARRGRVIYDLSRRTVRR
jgi:hypothetical protein